MYAYYNNYNDHPPLLQLQHCCACVCVCACLFRLPAPACLCLCLCLSLSATVSRCSVTVSACPVISVCNIHLCQKCNKIVHMHKHKYTHIHTHLNENNPVVLQCLLCRATLGQGIRSGCGIVPLTGPGGLQHYATTDRRSSGSLRVSSTPISSSHAYDTYINIYLYI